MKFARLETIHWARLGDAESTAEGHADFVVGLRARGYSGVWLVDSVDSLGEVPPSLALPAAGLATASSGLEGDFEIGLVTRLHPFMHPLRVAEEIAMLDIASEGRVRWAIAGETPFDGRAREQLEIIERAVTGEPVSYEGEFYRFEDVRCHPAPFREGGPPLGVVTGNGELARWARVQGFELTWDAFAAGEMRNPNADANGNRCASILTLHVTDGATSEAPEIDLAASGTVVGSPESCREQLSALRESNGLTHVVVRFGSGKLSPEQAAASERLFLEEVAPALA